MVAIVALKLFYKLSRNAPCYILNVGDYVQNALIVELHLPLITFVALCSLQIPLLSETMPKCWCIFELHLFLIHLKHSRTVERIILTVGDHAEIFDVTKTTQLTIFS